jgi:hypothetical protein
MFEGATRKVALAAGGALTGLLVLGGAAMAQTPGGTVTPEAPSATATAQPDGQATPGSQGTQPKDGKDCPRDGQAPAGSGASTRTRAAAGSGV